VGRLAATIALVTGAAQARADDDGADGVYGRLDGDLLAIGEAGAAVSPEGSSLALGARALYLSTAGVYVRYLEGFEQRELAAQRSISGGVELRPLFLARFARDLEHGPAHLDLLLDSIALDVGAFWWASPGGGLRSFPGLEVALGLEMPILPDASGPHVGAMGSLRVTHGGAGGAADDDINFRASALIFTLSWHGVVDAGIVDAGDAIAR
jgi:hypothetical protein